jgi:uncharacterized OB-fold protein
VSESAYAVYLGHLRRGELAYQFSRQANAPVFYPREVSPFDITERLEWKVSKGLGTVHSTTFVNDRKLGDYNVALIDCDEGFRLMSRVENIPPKDVRIGMRVRFQACIPAEPEEEPYPVFVPVQGDA